jgi:hypothetical protein
MLMQPQSPNPNFDFIMKDNQPAKRGPGMPNLPKGAKIALAAVGGIIILIIISSLISGRNKGSSQGFVGVLARGTETLRVTGVAQQQLHLQDPQTQALAATVSAALGSDQKQISAYLAQNNVKVSKLQLAADTDKSTDASLQAASQNNGLDAAYVNYLKTALTKYQADLQSAYSKAGPNGKRILVTSSESVRTLLNSAPFKP